MGKAPSWNIIRQCDCQMRETQQSVKDVWIPLWIRKLIMGYLTGFCIRAGLNILEFIWEKRLTEWRALRDFIIWCQTFSGLILFINFSSSFIKFFCETGTEVSTFHMLGHLFFNLVEEGSTIFILQIINRGGLKEIN